MFFCRLLFLILLFGVNSIAQSTLISPGEGVFDNKNVTQSLTIPKLSLQQILNYNNPKVGMMIYDIDNKCIKYYNGISWNCLNTTNENNLISCGDCSFYGLTNSFGYNGIDAESDSSGTYSVFTSINSNPSQIPIFLGSRLVKMNSNNSGFLWDLPIIITTNDPQLRTYKILLTKTSIYVLATFCGFITIINQGEVQPVGQSDLMVFKFDKNGNRKWVKLFGGVYQDIPTCITKDIFENIYVGGWFTSPSLRAGDFTVTNSYAPQKDGFILKLDSTGNVINFKNFGGVGDDEVKAIQNNPNTNEVLATGYFSGLANFCSQNLNSSGAKDLFILKTDYNLNCNYVNRVGGMNTTDEIIPVDLAFSANYSDFNLCANSKGTFNLLSILNTKATGFIYSADYAHPITAKSVTFLKNGNFAYFKNNYGIVNYGNDFSIGSQVVRNNTLNSTTIFKIDNQNNLQWYKSGGNLTSKGTCIAYFGANLNVYGTSYKASYFCGSQVDGVTVSNPLIIGQVFEKIILWGVRVND